MECEKTVEVLNDLIQINNDRISGYQKAIDESKGIDLDLKLIFEKSIADSETYKDELIENVEKYGGRVADGTTLSGKIYRAWMDTKNLFTGGGDRKSILESCEYGEDAAQKAYQSVLTSNGEVDSDVMKLIAKQKESLKGTHDTIKKYRDAQKLVQK